MKENDTQVSYGLLGYPVLQTADIIIYRAHAVPGRTRPGRAYRDSRGRSPAASNAYRRIEEIFPEPDAVINEFSGELPGMDGRKMSKSYDNAIYLSDTPKQTQKTINKAFTTPTKIRIEDAGVPEGCVACKLRRVYDPNAAIKFSGTNAVRGCGAAANRKRRSPRLSIRIWRRSANAAPNSKPTRLL